MRANAKTPRTGRPRLEHPDAIKTTIALRQSTIKVIKEGAKLSKLTLGQYLEECLEFCIKNKSLLQNKTKLN